MPIVSLTRSWNLMGVPFNYSIDLRSPSVQYNGEVLSWDEAIEMGIVLDIAYGWEVDHYYAAYTLEPGHGYWVLALENCTLCLVPSWLT